MRLALVLLAVAGCSSSDATVPRITGDSCAVYLSAAACDADTDCTWLGTGCACPPNDPSCTCGSGGCASKSGDGSGSGSGGAACVCPGDDVCFEQVGGPATTTPPSIDCATPTAGGGDPCARITGEGTCTPSSTVSGLCLCDNGIR